MKKIILGLMIIASFSTQAETIDFTTGTHSYSRWPDQMASIVAAQERVVDRYLGEKLDCRLVELNFNNLKSPSVFRDGAYNLTLKAKCNKSFSNFKMSVSYGYSLGEPVGLTLRYVLKGKEVKQIFKLDQEDN